jgi:hypothetical protein
MSPKLVRQYFRATVVNAQSKEGEQLRIFIHDRPGSLGWSQLPEAQRCNIPHMLRKSAKPRGSISLSKIIGIFRKAGPRQTMTSLNKADRGRDATHSTGGAHVRCRRRETGNLWWMPFGPHGLSDGVRRRGRILLARLGGTPKISGCYTEGQG